MMNNTSRLEVVNPGIYALKGSKFVRAFKPSLKTGLEGRLARRGLMVGLEIQGEYLKLTLVGTLNRKSGRLFKEFVSNALALGYNQLVLDLAMLHSLDGVGMATLVWVHNQVIEQQGHLVIGNLSRQVRTALLAVNLQYMVSLADYEYV